ncbi:MAG TPA: aminomethyl-transferring glycine dehydrogenase subunit GcvPA [Caulifigura sp.]|nr:aminomethyl-transferring glycine dehydrogenase subunit GcvPA [Caulifigura sp.]
MAYLFTTPEQQRQMLETIGAESIDSLFDSIPADLRLKRPLDLPPAMSELELEQFARELAARERTERACFMGGGAYDHFVPAVVDEVTSRGEFYTAYTPYQPEASQGSLQAFFEYQSLICRLTGMEASNASLYEGGTALSEAAFMAMRSTNRHSRIVVLGSVHPEYRQVLATYLANLSCELVTIPTPNGTADVQAVADAVDEHTSCVLMQHPNFFGCLEEVREITKIAQAKGALAVVSFDPISLGVLERPCEYGVDIAVAEGQSLGIPLQYGGPYLGVMACKNEHVRKMPGRIIAETKDRDGRRCYVLGLQTREQHIRRDKATSNICTNQGLLALRATVYLSLLGPKGLQEVATLCTRKAHYAAEQLVKSGKVELVYDRPYFKEFFVRAKGGTEKWLDSARAAGFDVGPSMSQLKAADPDLPEGALVAVTESRTRAEIDALAAV